MDQDPIGQVITDATGSGTLNYKIPATIPHDLVYVHAESYSPDGSLALSNIVDVNVLDKATTLLLQADKNTVSYGNNITISGNLSSTDGVHAPSKFIDLSSNNNIIGTAITDENGYYSYQYTIAPDTPAGVLSVKASYIRPTDDVFLNSTSGFCNITVQPLDTNLKVSDDSAFTIGSVAHVQGMLQTVNNVNVTGANVLVYIDNTLSGNGTTSNGAFDISVPISDNATSGSHELYAVFDPGHGKALNPSSSEKIPILFEDRSETAKVNGLPMVLFLNDTLNVSGMIVADGNVPVSNKPLYINFSNIVIDTPTTNDFGGFNALYTVTGAEPIGYYNVGVYGVDANRHPTDALYSGSVLLISGPFWLVLIICILAIILIAILIMLFLIRWNRRKKSVKVKDLSKKKTGDVTVVVPEKTFGDAEPMDKLRRSQFPAIQETEAVTEISKMPEPIPEAKPVPAFDFNQIIETIKSTISTGDTRTTMTLVYLTARNIAIGSKVDVPQSMTHSEFYEMMKDKFPDMDKPLSRIVSLYERAIFTSYSMDARELSDTVDLLNEIYSGIKKEGVSH